MEFESAVTIINKNNEGVELLKLYKNEKNKWWGYYKCSCGNYAHKSISGLYKGQKCSKCSGGIKLTINERNEILKEKGYNLIIISEIIDENKKIWFEYQCSCGKITKNTWKSMCLGRTCCYCSKQHRLNRSFEDTVEIIKAVNPSITILSQYAKNTSLYYNYICGCGTYTYATFKHLYEGGSCKDCGIIKVANARRRDLEDVKKIIFDINPNIEITSVEYLNGKTSLVCKCLIDGHVWSANANSLINSKTGCPKCYGNIKFTIEDIKNKLKENNLNITLLSEEYVNANTHLIFKCNDCSNIWNTAWSVIRDGCGCPICSIKNRSGSNHPMWKGGVNMLNMFLRENIYEWRKKSFENNNYLCNIFGINSGSLEIHHHKNFSEIVKETLKLLGLPIKKTVGEYTEEELQNIKNKCLELHYKYGLGICLNDDEHKLFHKTYGNKNNTEQQYLEFKEMRQKELGIIT